MADNIISFPSRDQTRRARMIAGMAVPDIPGLDEDALASGLASIDRHMRTSMAVAERLVLIALRSKILDELSRRD